MIKSKHIENLPLTIARIILCCLCFLLINCESKTGFKRNIDFESGWESSSVTNNAVKTSIFKKEFELDIRDDKLYLLQISSTEKVLHLQVNNTLVTGDLSNNRITYNITDQLKKQNTIELACRNKANFEAKIHCVNKLFIPDINLELESEKALIEIKIKNLFSSEKQGILKYTLYSVKDKKLEEKETPVFIAGNAENIYRQEFSFDAGNTNLKDLKVACQLYVENELFDRNEIRL